MNYLKAVPILAVLAVSASSFAASDLLKFTGDAAGGTGSLSGIANGNFVIGKLDMDDTTLGNITTVCADLYHDINLNDQWRNTTLDTASMTDTSGFYIKEAGNIVAHDFTGAVSNDQAEGLQLAVWEALYDNGASLDLTSGNVQSGVLSGNAYNYAVQYYADRNIAGDAHYFQAGLKTDNSGFGQSQLAPVPEPASIATLAIGAIGLFRKRKKA